MFLVWFILAGVGSMLFLMGFMALLIKAILYISDRVGMV